MKTSGYITLVDKLLLELYNGNAVKLFSQAINRVQRCTHDVICTSNKGWFIIRGSGGAPSP